MKLSKNAILIGMMGMILSVPAFAYDKNDEQIIRQDLAKMQHAMKNKNGKVMVDMMPEPVLQKMAEAMKVSLAEFRKMMVAMSKSMVNLNIKFQANLAKAQVHQSKTGRDYVFIPTKTTVDGATVNGKMLAIKDNGKWSYLTWQTHHKDLLKKAYPDIHKWPQ